MPPATTRVELDRYYMSVAQTVAERADCRHAVGAVIVLGDRVVATGSPGTPEGMANCSDGGCTRCAEESGPHHDLCLCVHAEESALLTAARHGISLEGGSIYTTHQPCFQCLKALLHAGIDKIYYGERWTTPSAEIQDLHDDYLRLAYHIPGGVRQIVPSARKAEPAPAPVSHEHEHDPEHAPEPEPAAPHRESRPKSAKPDAPVAVRHAGSVATGANGKKR